MNHSRSILILCLAVCAAVLICGCTSTSPGEGNVTQPAEEVKLKVFHAGSLTQPFEEIKAAFEEEHPNVEVLLEPAGSVACVRKITDDGKPADVLASADYQLIPQLMVPDSADWYLTFAKNQMVLAYTDDSMYADEINAGNWYEILGRDGVKWGFSDPNLDPCGYRTPMVIMLAETQYNDDNIFDNLIETNTNITATEEDGVWMIHACDPYKPGSAVTIRDKSVELVQMVQAGGIDYAWEYRSVAEQNDLKFVELPPQIDLSSIEYADLYQTVEEECVKGEGTTIYVASPIVYGITVPKIAEHPELGQEFVMTVIGPTGQEIMSSNGQPPIVPAGGFGDVPEDLLPLVSMQS